MEYKVVWYERNSIKLAVDSLEWQVKQMMEDGWRPIGTVSLAVTRYGVCTVAQAMVRED